MTKKQRRLTVGVLVSGIMDEFTEAVCRGVMQAAKTLDVNVVVLPGKYLDRDLCDNPELMYEYQYNTIFSYVKKENVDAIIVAAGSIGCHTSKERMEEMLAQYKGIPCVLVASKLDGYVDVAYDNYNGIREGLEYLINQVKCRKLGMIGGPMSSSDAVERKQAFMETLQELGVETPDSLYVEGDYSRRCREAFCMLLDRNPDIEAVFCVNDETALGFYDELKKRNLVPGKDISVFGYDDTITAAKTQPSLSSVKADPAELGENALKMVLRMAYGEKVESKVMPTKFVLRESFCKAADQEEEFAARMLENSIDGYFDDIFYRYKHEEIREEMEELHRNFKELLQKIMMLYEQSDEKTELYMDIQSVLDTFLRNGAVEYADMGNLLVVFEKIYHALQKRQTDYEDKFELRDLFSIIYRKIIKAMDYRFGLMKEAEEKNNYSMKLFIRDMLQFEKGNDQSYASRLNNLEWLNIRNAFIYVFEKPIMHLYREKFAPPHTLYLKAILKEGKVISVPAISQKYSIKDIFQNHGVETEERTSLVLLPLFSNELLYGLLLCDLSPELFVNGEFLVNQMSSAMKMIALLKSNEEIQQQLEESLATLKENNIVLDNLSRSDSLTGILNRRGFYDAAGELLEENRNTGRRTLVIYVDMNNLKIINDRYGHEEGDYSLQLIGEILAQSMAGKGLAGRIGGDEFACIMEYETAGEGTEVLTDIYKRFDESNLASEKPYNVTVCAGACVLSSTDTLTLQEAMTQADEKLYEIKKLRPKEVAKKTFP